MVQTTAFKPAVKVALFYGLFMILYGVYRFFPFFPLSIIAGIVESNFQHYKATFFCFLIANGIEYLVYRKRVSDLESFWYPRLLNTIFAPWVVFLLWYIAPAVYGKFPTVFLEILYANIITILVAVVVVMLEGSFLTMRLTRPVKIVILVLLVVSIGLYIIFTFSHLPWADVFVEPDWR
jgi:hypothetical protein